MDLVATILDNSRAYARTDNAEIHTYILTQYISKTEFIQCPKYLLNECIQNLVSINWCYRYMQKVHTSVLKANNRSKRNFQSESEIAKSWRTSLPGSSVHGIFQARVLEWIAISFSRGSSRPRNRTRVSRTAGRCFTIWATREAILFNPVYPKHCHFNTLIDIVKLR